MDFQGMNNFWDMSQQPAQFSTIPDEDFLEFLNKQFPASLGGAPVVPALDGTPAVVNPQDLTSLLANDNTPPSSDDSSPSPPSIPQEPSPRSRPQSGASHTERSSSVEQHEDSTLKRKASSESFEEPSHKSQHTSNQNSAAASPASAKKSTVTSSRRKSTGDPKHDESRLMKRKEQNRAAQRAFRERKEKHVKDLEDKVAALEAKNQLSETENENLRDLLQRLQNENMMLKQAAFTFSVPHDNNASAPPSYHTTSQFNFSTPGAGPSRLQQPPPPPQPAINFNSLIPFDPNMLTIDESDNMNVDPFSFGQNDSAGGYKTIASNPDFMSFAEPSPWDKPAFGLSSLTSGNGNDSNGNNGFGSTPFDSWSPPNQWSSPEGASGMDALDQIFGGGLLGSGHGNVDFAALAASPPSSISPVSHASLRTNSGTSSKTDSPQNGSTPMSSPPSSGASPAAAGGAQHNRDECPRTKEEVSQMIREQGPSLFAPSPLGNSVTPPAPGMGSPGAEEGAGDQCSMPMAPILRKGTMEGDGSPIVMCKGSNFPKTEKSDKNVEVLAAWRSITSNPQFKDIDINELCAEFTSKARCDGTKVVLEPQGVRHIVETLAARGVRQPTWWCPYAARSIERGAGSPRAAAQGRSCCCNRPDAPPGSHRRISLLADCPSV
ncbi:hypothetical protein CERSUDRAFT_109986 [Gelatoporia subvermispora B]|uniref:BZIP domain-containing protein n=1 Tax=Ceriporiopsis subvermispora (strain B) TaxID=914234 RepID=M2PX29_CERS8|nr:hypothetical protein CERSUDRAFT_109986 [Gelatoporia subvermispora B]